MGLADKVADQLAKIGGFTPDQISQVNVAIANNFPSKTYIIAVCFLGAITLTLAVGAIWLVLNDKENIEALWGVLGAGIGGLAGIFAARE